MTAATRFMKKYCKEPVDSKRFQSFLLPSALMMAFLLSFISCSSDSPKGERYPVRADIVGAQSLILSNGSSTRGGDDYKEFKEAGLYKVDKDGNVSAVAVYLHEDGSTSEEEVRVIPEAITQLSDRYVMLINCELTNSDGVNVIWPRPSMIVDLSTGKIYKYDEFFPYHSHQLSDSRFLIWGQWSNSLLGELNIDNGVATYRQLTNDEGKGFINPNYSTGGYINQLPNGVILSQRFGKINDCDMVDHDMGILYPNKGYDYLQDYEKEFLSDPNDWAHEKWDSFVLKDRAAIAKCIDKYDDSNRVLSKVISWSFVEFGNTPNDINIIPTDELVVDILYDDLKYYYDYLEGYYETDDNIIFILGDPTSSKIGKILIFNKQTNRLSEFTPSFSEKMIIYPSAYYKGRVWDVFTDKTAQGVKALWINPDTRESGSFDLDLMGVDIDKIERHYNLGKVVLYGTRRSDAAYVVASLNLETEKTDIQFTLPKQETITLIPLN